MEKITGTLLYVKWFTLVFLGALMVDLVYVGRALIYASLVFSISSAVSYVRLFSAAVEAKEERQRGEG